MNLRPNIRIAGGVRFSAVFGLLATCGWPAAPTFQHDVLPLLEKKCVSCHGAGNPVMAGLDLRTLTGVMAGSSNGPVVIPGNPDGSKLWLMVRDGKMPMGGEPLSNAEKQLVRDWICLLYTSDAADE